MSWPLPAEQDEGALEALLYPRRQPGIEVHPTPDFEWIERELKRKHVTRRQLWREYLARYPDGLKYTMFCVKFLTISPALSPYMASSMRIAKSRLPRRDRSQRVTVRICCPRWTAGRASARSSQAGTCARLSKATKSRAS